MVSVRTVVVGVLALALLGAGTGGALENGEITAETGVTQRFIESLGEWPPAAALEILLPEAWRGQAAWPEIPGEQPWDEPPLVAGGVAPAVTLPQAQEAPVLGAVVEQAEGVATVVLDGDFAEVAPGDLLCGLEKPQLILEFSGAFNGTPLARALAGARPEAGTQLTAWRPASAELIPHADRRPASARVQASLAVGEAVYLRLLADEGELPGAGRLVWILRPHQQGLADLVGAAVVVWSDTAQVAVAWPFRTATEPQPGDRVVGAVVPQ